MAEVRRKDHHPFAIDLRAQCRYGLLTARHYLQRTAEVDDPAEGFKSMARVPRPQREIDPTSS